jgi:hypothetical protein
MISSGDRLHHVSASGKVQTVTATEDEYAGRVDVKTARGETLNASTFDLFNSEVAANRAAVARLPGSFGSGGMATVRR